MILVTVGFKHYSPKDSEEGIKELILVNDMAQAISYIDKEYLHDTLAEDDSDDEESFTPDEEWWKKNEHKRATAAAMGLEIDEEWNDVKGPGKALTLWLEHNDWKDTSDAFYGVTHWNWDRHQEITAEDAAALLRLGLAKDMREWKPDTEG